MRTATVRHAADSDSEELLTTGEAARILGSSRQHVVDLCEAGLLPYVTIGTHRRISRRDLEAARTRTERPSRDQRRSIWLNVAVAGKFAAQPEETLRLARENLTQLTSRHPRGQAAHWLGEWATLLEGPPERIMEVLTSTTQYAREMRQNSPFSGVLTDEERHQVLEAFRRYDSAKSQNGLADANDQEGQKQESK